ncbi:LppU/SCO3897 family protein [Saccharothrix yanglingensis]|uniref:Uncharacterized protein n=1 Tax=Saccharothrix yanglingensis TaxID=659496 RepID=A0ABU0WY48_9PSEU|nr:hypothetical protein [Saccharothrix yanglingensis]MDQ2584448.1 hypothetical protein [Saccharothrix yanglingensis]
MSNEPTKPDDDAPEPVAGGASPAKPTASSSPDTPATGPADRTDAARAAAAADADRVAAAEAAAANAREPELAPPASSSVGPGSAGSGSAGSTGAAPESGAGARDQPVAGNEPVTPAGPTPVPGARQVPSADPVTPGADDPASPAPAVDEPTGGDRVAAPGAAAGGSAAGVPAGTAAPAGAVTPSPPARPVGEVPPGPGAAIPGAAPADSISDSVPPARPADDGEPARGTGGGGKKVLIGVLIVLLVGVVVYGVRMLTNDASNAEAGDCVSLTSQSEDRADVDTLDCSADKASYKVGKVLEATDATCPEDGLYTEIAPASRVGDGFKLCLLPNMAEGACYKPDEGTGFVKTECTGPETIKVTKVIQGSVDLEGCPDAAGMSYPEPAVTYCLAPAEE